MYPSTGIPSIFLGLRVLDPAVAHMVRQKYTTTCHFQTKQLDNLLGRGVDLYYKEFPTFVQNLVKLCLYKRQRFCRLELLSTLYALL